MNPNFPIPRIKVCGLTRVQDTKLALDSGADAIGAIAVPETPRFVPPQKAKELFALATTQAKVMVSRDLNPQKALAWIEHSGASHIQLCGTESPADWRDFPYPILRRVGVSQGASQEAQSWSSIALALLLDHPSCAGGSGKNVDFAIARELASRWPCILAGGLNGENVPAAIEAIMPQGVDASSGLESAPAHKDPLKLARYVQAAQRAFASIRSTS